VQRHELLDSLVALTGDLRPAAQSSAAELTDLRRAFVRKLQSQAAPTAVAGAAGQGDASLLSDLNYLVTEGLAATAGGPVDIVRRGSPMQMHLDPAAPEWARGLAPQQTLGPFLDVRGRHQWFDVFTVPTFTSVRRGAAAPFLFLPAAVGRHPAGKKFEFATGSLWLDAHALAASAPAESLAGIRVMGGTLTVSAAATSDGSVLTIPATATLTLEVTLDPPAWAGPDINDGAGAEAQNTTTVLPSTVTFVFAPASASVETGTASFDVYGNHYDLQRSQEPPVYDPLLRLLLVPQTASSLDFSVNEKYSSLFNVAGSAKVTRAAWGLVVNTAGGPPQGDAANAGYMLVTVTSAASVTADWPGLEGGPITLSPCQLLGDGVSLLVVAGTARGARARHRVELWQEAAAGKRSSVEISFANGFFLLFNSLSAGFDNVFALATSVANLDRPLASRGSRVDSPMPVAYALLQDQTQVSLIVGPAPLLQDRANSRMALALDNALITTTLPLEFGLAGKLDAPTRMDSGFLDYGFGIVQILPILPDPYAANFSSLFRDSAVPNIQVVAFVLWANPADAALSLILYPFNAPAPAELLPRFGTFHDHQLRFFLQDVPPFRTFNRQGLALLDVSSNSDRLGVSVQPGIDQHSSAAVLSNLHLSVPGASACVFLLPQFQWEPVQNLPHQRTGDHVGTLFMSDDGGPTLLCSDSVRLVPVAPVAVVGEVVRSYSQDAGQAGISFTLPFGKQAAARLNRSDRQFMVAPSLELLQPVFPEMKGAREVVLRAGTVGIRLHKFMIELQPLLPGKVIQQECHMEPAVPPPLPPGPNPSVLGMLKDQFETDFEQEVPLLRIDFSGYGANVFSRWVREDPNRPIAISQVTFDGFHGRTSYERVQMTSIVWPCQATFVRTVTIERYGSGVPKRYDSGWLATTPGLFYRKDTPDIECHPGIVRGIYDIREIRDTGLILTLANGDEVEAVYFDGDMEIEGLQNGGMNSRVPVSRQLGFVQVKSASGKALTKDQLDELLRRQPQIGGAVDCVVRVGKSAQTMRLANVFTERAVAAGSPDRRFAVAAYGSLSLPASGQWSVVRVQNTGAQSGNVTPLDAKNGVPLVRVGRAGASAGNNNPYYWKDPQDMFAPPQSDYALLFSSESQRLLFPQPKIDAAGSNITTAANPPGFIADPYAMLRSTGLFPNTADAIPFDRNAALSAASGALQLVPPKLRVNASKTNTLVNASSWTAKSVYAAGHIDIDSGNKWNIDADVVSQKLSFLGVTDLMTITHAIHSPVDANPAFNAPQVTFAKQVDAVKDVLDFLKSLDPVQPENRLGPLRVSASFAGSTFHLLALGDFQIGPDGEPVDSGVGKLQGELKVGADLTADLLAGKAGGQVFLDIRGTYQQMVFPFIYGGGSLRFFAGVDQSGKTTFELDACTVGSVGGNLIPGLVEVEATVKYGYFVQTDLSDFQPGIIIGMEGRAKLLAGLLGFKMGIEGRLRVQRLNLEVPPSVRLAGDIRVAGTVTVAWLVDEDKSFHTQFSVKVDWKLAAVAVFGPVALLA